MKLRKLQKLRKSHWNLENRVGSRESFLFVFGFYKDFYKVLILLYFYMLLGFFTRCTNQFSCSMSTVKMNIFYFVLGFYKDFYKVLILLYFYLFLGFFTLYKSIFVLTWAQSTIITKKYHALWAFVRSICQSYEDIITYLICGKIIAMRLRLLLKLSIFFYFTWNLDS